MHLRSKIRLSCSVALLSVWLASVCLSACANTVLVGKACAAACEEENSEGLYYFNLVSGRCVCNGCSAACSKSVCGDHQTPSDACLPCVQESLEGDACNGNGYGAYFKTACLSTDACVALVECLVACPE